MKYDNLLNVHKRKISCMPCGGAVSVEPITDRPSNIYENGDVPKKIGFIIRAKEKSHYTVSCKFTDSYENETNLGETAAVTDESVYAEIPDVTELFGAFTLEISVSCGGEEVCRQAIPFSHIKTADSHFKKSGTGVHLIFHDKPDTYSCIALLKKAGIRKVRDDLNWHCNETEKGKIVIRDNFIATTNKFIDEGFELNIILDYGNPLYDNNEPPYSEEGIAAYARYCAAVAEHYKGRVFRYEIWNEYNLQFGDKIATPARYAKMLKAAYSAIKEIDPKITVTAGVTCGTQPEWIRGILKSGAYDYFDEISIHPYCGMPDWAYPDENQGQTEENVQSYIDVISQFGEPKPVWISEMGWISGVAEGVVTREEQAAALTRLFVISETSSVINGLTFYDFRDDGPDYFDKEHHFGLVESEWSLVPNAAKESYAAISFLNCMLAGGNFESKSVTDCIKQTVYRKNGGGCTNIFWSLDGAKKVILKLSGNTVLYDMYGNKKELTVQNGAAELEIDENVTYICGGSAEIVKVSRSNIYRNAFPYTLSAAPELKEDGWYIKAVMHNHETRITGKLRIAMPELGISGKYVNVTAEKGESFEVSEKVEAVDSQRVYRAVAALDLENGIRESRQELVSFLAIPKGKPENTIIRLDSRKGYKQISGAPVPDVTADIALSYDSERLYFKASVKDKTHLQIGTTYDCWKDIWDGDGIEMIIQPLYDGNNDITRYSHIGLALTSNTGESIAWRWATVSNRSNGRFRNCEFIGERQGDTTVYTAAFKWKDLLPPNISFEDCDSFGFVLRLNNSDNDPLTVDGSVQLYGGMGSWRDPLGYLPREFGRFVLQK